MAEVDTSIYNNIAQPNALQNLGTNLGAINQINHNKLFQQEFQARQGLGQAAQGAIDPATGNLDPQAYAQQLASNKQTGFLAMEGYKEGLAAQKAQLENQLSQVSLLRQKNDLESQALFPLLNKPDVTKDDIHRAAADVVIGSMDQNGKPLISANDVLGYFGSRKDPQGNVVSPGLDDLPDNPMALNQFLKQRYASGQAIAGHLDNVKAATYSKYLAFAPDQEVVSQDANGRPIYAANANATPSQTVGTQPMSAPGGATAVQQAPITPMKGSSPLSGAFTQSQAPGTQGNNVQLSMPPGQEEMLAGTGHSASDRVGQTIQNAQNARVMQDIDQQTINVAQALGKGVGPVSTEITAALGRLADAPIIGPLLRAAAEKDPTDNAAQLQVLQKWLARRAQLGGQAAGAGTDFTQGLNLDAQPHDKQFSSVMQELARYNMSLDMMTQGKATAMQNHPQATSSPAANEDFENKFRNVGNVNVYRAMLAPPEEQAKIFAKMSPSEKKQMILDRRELLKMGAIPPQMTGNSQGPATAQAQ